MSCKQNADERIIRHRTSDLDIVVLNGRGEPIPGARVELGMQRHGFGFGTAVNSEYLLDSGKGSPYCRLIPKLFNNAVLENRHKSQPEARIMDIQPIRYGRGIQIW